MITYQLRTIIAIALLCLPSATALQWSEIMFNPAGADDGKEFIELIGNESLHKCTIRDRTSSDTLSLNTSGTSAVILIVEDNSTWTRNPGDATIYTAGKAIGNGLDNTYDELTIACNNTTALTSSYNASRIAGYKEGMSAMWRNDEWVAGATNGTPGTIMAAAPNSSSAADASQTPSNTTIPAASSGGGQLFCNTTLLITVSNTTVLAGDYLTFTILSEEYATFDVRADNESILAGDTLKFREYGINVPDAAHVQIAASMRACDSRQRASRTINVLPRPAPAIAPLTATDERQPEWTNTSAATSEQLRAATRQPETITQSLTATIPAPPPDPAPAVTGHVVLDTDRSIVPWVSAFGIVTMLVSALVLWQLRKEQAGQEPLEERPPPSEEKPRGRRTKYIRRWWGTPAHEGEPDTRAPQQGMGPRHRHVRSRGQARRPRGESAGGVHREHQEGF